MRSGKNLMLSPATSCGLAPDPLLVMVALYVPKISTSLLWTASRASSNLDWLLRSTALLASNVASAIWSTDEYSSEIELVVGSASVTTRIRRSPNAVVCRTAVWNTTNGAEIGSSIWISIAYDWSIGTAGSDSKSVDRTKKLPWNADMRIPGRCVGVSSPSPISVPEIATTHHARLGHA